MTNSSDVWLQTADEFGRQLCRDAIWSDGRCSWMGWSMEPISNAWVPAYRSFGPDLYSGTSGIALFLARLYSFTQDRLQRATLEGAVNQALSRCSHMDDMQKPGFYAGLTGIAYALIEIGEILKHDGLIQRGLEEMLNVCKAPPSDRAIDVIGGGAGGIPAWIDISRRYGQPRLLELAVRHGKNLLKLASKTDEGWSWDTMNVPGQKNLVGYSHGTAGLVCAFLELHQATRREQFLEAARGGLRYERTHYSPEYRNWPDFRQLNPAAPTHTPTYSIAWCHGAAGVGLGRLRTAELLPDDPQVAEEIEQAIQTTHASVNVTAAGQNNYSLCHGISGNADLLLLAADQLRRPELRQAAEQAGRAGIEGYQKTGTPWPCGLVQAGETPNLMLGLAGIGYFYLRLHDSSSVPSILIIRPQPQ